ncbi:PEGA domain-containing protein [Methanoregula sp. PtaB.Bin085]|uniref:PEGA domain-containing protein n=1 Tax=Methanoregula sp. PtaB.Bin085 TaxID=1811680 RepID=UPI0009CEF29F|nr:PEGA domain-containing protein [Methanoregula sp. PtaB.Bin085]OPX61558.1 MAG: PEGA domain protein [Methanoregula sp. PtaB.Bin085]
MHLNPCRDSCTRLVLAACLLIATVPGVIADETTNATASAGGTIMVMSFPQGASIYLNDEYMGITPKKLEHIPPGKYLVNISKAGSNNDSAPVVLYDGSYREIGFTLESATTPVVTPSGSGSIAVSSTPGGATVRLDGTVVGTTRLERASLILNDIPTGSHTVTVELAGYPLYTGTVTVKKNQVVKVTADLGAGTPAAPVLTFGSPAEATARGNSVPLSPLGAVAAACLAGLAAASRRS